LGEILPFGPYFFCRFAHFFLWKISPKWFGCNFLIA
jgi:hypothetical protein